MFWQKKKETIEWPLLFFGFIAFGIIISVAILIIMIFSKANQTRSLVAQRENLPPVIEVSPPNVVKNYEDAISDFILFVSSTPDTVPVMMQKAEEIFLQVRVPSQKRDEHLKVFFTLESLKKQADNLTLDEARETLIKLLESLKTK